MRVSLQRLVSNIYTHRVEIAVFFTVIANCPHFYFNSSFDFNCVCMLTRSKFISRMDHTSVKMNKYIHFLLVYYEKWLYYEVGAIIFISFRFHRIID